MTSALCIGSMERLHAWKKAKLLINIWKKAILLFHSVNIGLYEMTKLMKDVSHTTPEGEEFALRVMKYLRAACDKWKKETGLGFALYGTPAESLCYRFARIDKERFGTIADVTDKGYYTILTT